MSELTHAGGKGESFCDVRQAANDSPPTDAGEQVEKLRKLAALLVEIYGDEQESSKSLRSAAATIERLTAERDAAVASKDAEIEILVDLLKRGFKVSNREGWEEGENKTEWQSVASDALATYDEQFRDSGLRTMESLVALERQQGATIERLTRERDEAVKVIERLPKTKDGVVVYYEEQELFHPNETAPHHHNEFHPAGTCIAYFGDHSDRCSERLSTDCYSTREAALSKQEGK